MRTKVTIVGCGDIGGRVAEACLAKGDLCTGWVRSDDRVMALREQRIPTLKVDLDPRMLGLPSVEDHDLFYFVPPPAKGKEDSRVAHLIDQLSEVGQPRKVVYLSTSGVYGDSGGEWVDETRAPAPSVDRAFRRLDAENRWREWSRKTGGELVILRVAGIYGPGKLPLERLRQGRPMVAEVDSPITNHIHTHDLVEICLAAMERGVSGEVYNVCDGHPGTMTGYFNAVADFFDLPRPPVISLAEAEQTLTPGMLSYLGESRRLSNRKLVEELGVILKYPTLETGLPACL
ncbi:MAG: SDR family oxidoreductase [Candidatus Thiodiazotropha sp. (ex Myrtea sp. 'scaly one' KF741663)]|nr:SDR family oxidoreductase [Candidatus Thiodiazotropha sp. (ex Myrtea sp. 'scaly one' KF741663)]